MNRNQVRAHISMSWKIAEQVGVAETFSNPSPLSTNEEFRNIAFAPNSTYSDVYLCGLQLTHYNFMLSDHSFFQFSCTKDRHVRYAYYPNPFSLFDDNQELSLADLQEAVRADALSVDEYAQYLADRRIDLRIPPFRYECAPDQYQRLKHPTSHLHIGFHTENRWAFSRIISPTAFTLLILKHYFSEFWWLRGVKDDDECGNLFESRLLREKQSCTLLSPIEFHDIEGKSFSFS